MANTELEALVVKLEADTASFRAELLASQKSVEGSSKKIEQALSQMATKGDGGLNKLAGSIRGAFGLFAAGGAAYVAIKTIGFAMDQVFEGESIRSANAQFEMLASNAGIAGQKLRDALKGAADGLVDDTDMIMAANRALVSMGSAAKDLPQVMELAKKATAVFGGEVSTNFEAMSQAIANGQTRQLKNLGIVVDQEAAYKKFAGTLGVTAAELTEAGKQQALMNAVLAQGDTAFSGVDSNLKKNTNSWTAFKVTMKDISEVLTLAFEKIAGPKVQSILGGLAAMAADAKRALVANFGEGSEQATAEMERLQAKIMSMKGTLIDLEQKKMRLNWLDPMEEQRIAEINRHLPVLQAKLDAVRGKVGEYKTQQEGANKATEDAAAKTRDLVVVKNQLAEAGQKMAEQLTAFSPETVQKAQLELLTMDYENHLITLEEYYAAQGELLTNKIATEQAMLDEAHANKLIGDTKYAEAKAALEAKAEQDKLKMDNQRKKDEQKQTEERLGYTSKFFGDLSSLSKTKSKELYEIGKAASVAQAIVDGYAAVQKTLASVPYPFSIPLAAAAGVAAAANVASIVSAPYPAFATGGIVPGSSTIGDEQLIRANAGEAVLTVPQQRRLLAIAEGNPAGGGGGGSNEGIMQAILAQLQRLDFAPVIQIDGREVFSVVKGQLAAGRTF